MLSNTNSDLALKFSAKYEERGVSSITRMLSNTNSDLALKFSAAYVERRVTRMPTKLYFNKCGIRVLFPAVLKFCYECDSWYSIRIIGIVFN
jgi:hypothetical protein